MLSSPVATEILATLDKDGTLEGMPFMPETIAHVGRRYTVTRRVEKTCNMVDDTGGRRMRRTVYLADLRCDGSPTADARRVGESIGRRTGFGG